MDDRVITLQRFFDRARAGVLTAIRCGRCGELAMPPKEFCPGCHQRAWEPVDLSGTGTVASWTVIRVAPASHAAATPYAVAAVKLAEGPSLLGRLVDIPLDTVAIGLPVKFKPLAGGPGETAVGFGPA